MILIRLLGQISAAASATARKKRPEQRKRCVLIRMLVSWRCVLVRMRVSWRCVLSARRERTNALTLWQSRRSYCDLTLILFCNKKLVEKRGREHTYTNKYACIRPHTDRKNVTRYRNKLLRAPASPAGASVQTAEVTQFLDGWRPLSSVRDSF